MQFQINIPKTPSSHVAMLQAGRSALTTAILLQNHTFDLSRLSLINFSMSIDKSVPIGPAKADTEFIKTEASEAGQHYKVVVKFEFGSIAFEIVDRRRGLRTNILRELPQSKMTKGDLTLEIHEGEQRALEDLVLEALPKEAGPQISFHICGKYIL